MLSCGTNIVRCSRLASLAHVQGECLTAFSAYKEMLGIKAVSWSPSGQLLAIGDFEQASRVACFAVAA